ncbi:uncharacterized protein LOC123395072 [Hordeum vulgare subsp. vulgare]|uniref:uncharacterized protein LOC123395072 n=1 Tax=Hordeum vulgare subsp. vulgare TaxID=112509 RepID=UPI001D1A4ABD|nr:uncharacterized protein LOC123395072 [Hordeum vulgare subsp. vulgare]
MAAEAVEGGVAPEATVSFRMPMETVSTVMAINVSTSPMTVHHMAMAMAMATTTMATEVATAKASTLTTAMAVRASGTARMTSSTGGSTFSTGLRASHPLWLLLMLITNLKGMPSLLLLRQSRS